MTLEQKKLVVREICARMPYGIRVQFGKTNYTPTVTEIDFGNGFIMSSAADPYMILRNFSSITEEEKKEYFEACDRDSSIAMDALDAPWAIRDKQGFIYGTCENIEKEKASIKENLKAKIEKKLDYYNSVSVRKSLIDKISNKVDNLMTMITNHKGNRNIIYNELSLIKQFINVMLTDKYKVK